MAYKKPKITKKEVSQKFNLSEIFERDFRNDPELRDFVGQAIIDKIIDRTESGKGIGGNKSLKKPYSKSYSESQEFIDNGKSRNSIDMTLTGSMLDDIDIVDKTTNTIKIGFTEELETLKAYNHNIGDTVPKRPFFGLSKSEVKQIKKELKNKVKSLPKKTNKDDSVTVGSFVENISNRNLFKILFPSSDIVGTDEN